MGLWRIHILHHAASRDVWGAWLLDELAAHGHRLSPGTLYPALTRLERHGWLRRNGRPAHLRARQCFRITHEGRRVLQSLRRDVSQLYAEVVAGVEPAPREASGRKHGRNHPALGGAAAHGPRGRSRVRS